MGKFPHIDLWAKRRMGREGVAHMTVCGETTGRIRARVHGRMDDERCAVNGLWLHLGNEGREAMYRTHTCVRRAGGARAAERGYHEGRATDVDVSVVVREMWLCECVSWRVWGGL